jgi:hypothetical protein
LSGSSPASIALGIMWPHKPHHYVKVGIPSGGGRPMFIYDNSSLDSTWNKICCRQNL